MLAEHGRIETEVCSGSISGLRFLRQQLFSHDSKQRPVERCQLAMQDGVRRVGSDVADTIRQQSLKFRSQLFPGFSILRDLPLSDQRTGRDNRIRTATSIRLTVEMPDAGVAVSIRVRVADKDIGRDVFGEVPTCRNIILRRHR